LSHRSRTSLGAFSPCKVDSTRQSVLWWIPAGFSQGPVCESRPGLFTRLGQSGCWTLQVDRWDHKTCRAVHGVRTVRGSVTGLRMNLWRSCRLDPWPRRNSRPNHSSKADCRLPSCSSSCLSGRAFLTKTDRRLDQTTPHTADRRLDTSSFSLAFLGLALLDRLRGYVIGPSFEFAAALRQWVADTSR